jgi:hypothetical protein
MDKNFGIPKDALINIKISGAFYMNMQQMLYSLASQKTPEEFTAIMHKLKSGTPENEYEFQILTLVSLVMEVERSAKEQNLLVEVELPKPTDESSKV